MGLRQVQHRQRRWKQLTLQSTSQFNVPQLNPRSTKILLLRNGYKLAYDTIRQVARTRRCIFLITGHSGIGESGFHYSRHQLIALDREDIILVVSSNLSTSRADPSRAPNRCRRFYSLRQLHRTQV